MYNSNTNKLIELIYESAINPSKWTELLKTVAEFVDHVEKESDSYDQNILTVTSKIQSSNGKESNTSLAETLKSITNIDEQGQIQSTNAGEMNELLLGHFSRALKIAKRLVDVDDQHNIVLSLLDRMPVALVLVDSKGWVIETNALADEMLNENGGVSIKSNALDFGTGNNKRALDAIEQMSKHDSAITRGKSLSITNEQTENNIMLFIAPLRQQGAQQKASVAVFISQRKSIPMSLPEEFSELYGLTAKEVEVTQLLVRGLSINEISKESTVSTHTVRSQVKSILKKTQTSRQAELVSLVYNGLGGFVNSIPENKLNKRNGLLSKSKIGKQDYKILLLEDGRNMSYSEYGDLAGEPVFHCHSVLGSRLELALNAHEISQKKSVRLIIIDRPGNGASDPNSDTSFTAWVKDLVQLADHLHINKFSLTGYAMGGIYALACAHEIPERLKRVAIISAGMPAESKSDYKTMIPLYKMNTRLAKYLPSVFCLITAVTVKGILSDPASFFEQFNEYLGDADKKVMSSNRFKDEMFLSLMEGLRLGGKAASKEVIQLMHDWEFDLNKISTTIDIWHGKQDYHVPYVLGERFTKNIKNTRTFIKEEQGHLFFYTHWEEILNEVLKGA